MNNPVSPRAGGEGKYLDLTTNTVRPLLRPGLGYDAAEPPQTFTATSTTLTETLRIPSDTILQGAGVGQTVLKSNYNGMLVTARGSSNSDRVRNVVIRDLTIFGNGGDDEYGILIEYAENVLIERCELVNIGRRGIGWLYTDHITIRYCTVDGVRIHHCLSCKDHNSSHHSTSYAIYSNHLANAGEYCLDTHAKTGEVCGNVMVSGKHSGMKCPDAQDLWVHHNAISDGPQDLKIDQTLTFGPPRSLFFFNNTMPPFQMKDGAIVVAVANTYHSGGHRISGGATLITDPNAPEAAPILPYLDDAPTEPPVEPPPIEPPVEPPTSALTEADVRRIVDEMLTERIQPVADALYDAAYGGVPFHFRLRDDGGR